MPADSNRCACRCWLGQNASADAPHCVPRSNRHGAPRKHFGNYVHARGRWRNAAQAKRAWCWASWQQWANSWHVSRGGIGVVAPAPYRRKPAHPKHCSQPHRACNKCRGFAPLGFETTRHLDGDRLGVRAHDPPHRLCGGSETIATHAARTGWRSCRDF